MFFVLTNLNWHYALFCDELLMRFRSLNKKMMMVCKQDQSFGIISKFLEFKASGLEPRI